MKKEKFVLVIVVAFSLLFSLGLIMAQDFSVSHFYEQTKQAFLEIFGPLLNVDTADEFLFAKILLFILIFSLLFVILKNIELFEHNKPVHVIVSVIASLFAVRYMGPWEFVRAIFLPYTALGATLSVFIPVAGMFFLVHISGLASFGRRMLWLLFGTAFFTLYMSMPSSDVPMVNWLYFAGFFCIIISIAADKHIHGLFQSAKHRKKFREVYEMRIANLLKTAAEYTNIGDLAMAKKFEKKAKRLAKKL